VRVHLADCAGVGNGFGEGWTGSAGAPFWILHEAARFRRCVACAIENRPSSAAGRDSAENVEL